MSVWDNREIEDLRPVIARCELCGRYIYGSDYAHYGDTYYDIDSCAVCEECITDYVNIHYKKEG